MRLLLIAMMLAVLSGCGAYSDGSAGNDTGQQSQMPTTGNGGGGGGGY